MTFSLLHVYLQTKSTLNLHTCSCILMTFYTVCMFYYYYLIISCSFVHVLLHVHSTSFGIFYQHIKLMLTSFQIVLSSYYICFNYNLLMFVLIGNIKCIHTITVTTIYPF